MGSASNATLDQDSFPSEFGEFRLLGRLARGRQGDVYYAVRSADGGGREAWLALKQLAPDLALDRDLVDRWLRAADRAARLNHPVLCRTVGTGTVQGSPFCAMELCAGLDLARICDRLKERDESMPVRCAAFVMSQVAAGLEAAHHHAGEGWTGIVHGDLRPSDVMVGYDGSVKVINLGLSKALEGSSAEPQPIVAADVNADVMALGRCLSSLLGPSDETLPLRPSSVAEAGDPASDPSGLNALRMVSARALRPRAGARFEGAAAFGRALDQFLTARGVPFAVETLSTWMNSTFQSELRTSRVLERRIMDDVAPGHAAPREPGPSVSPPRRVGAGEEEGLDIEVAVAGVAATPIESVLSSLERGDPDKTPPKGILAERLASEMWTDDAEPTRVGQLLWSDRPPAAQTAGSTLPAAPEPVRSSPPPLLSTAAPLWVPSQAPRGGATALRVVLAAAAVVGLIVLVTQREAEPSSRRSRSERKAEPASSVAAVPSAAPPAAAPDTTEPATLEPSSAARSTTRKVARPRRSKGAPLPGQVGESAEAQPVSDEVHEAVLTSRPAPQFPALARERGVDSGNVVLSFTVDSSGTVKDPVVVESTPPGVFDAAALEAVSAWRYRPRSEAGVAVETHDMRARLDFSDRR